MKRPDLTDQAIAAEKARARHQRCVCGDSSPCRCVPAHTPSQGWRRPGWWLATWSDLRLIYAHIAASKAEASMPGGSQAHEHISHSQLRDRLSHYVTKGDLEHHLTRIERAIDRLEEISTNTNRKVNDMSVDVSKVLGDIQTLVAGSQAKDALIKQLQDALAAADATQAKAVADAVASDESGIQASIDAADSVAQEYLNPPVDTPPADGSGDGSAPVDGGDGSAPVDSGDGSAPVDGGDVPPAA